MHLIGHDQEARALAAAGKPLICFLGHLGNWDTAGAWSTGHFAHVTTVAERLKPEEVFQEFSTSAPPRYDDPAAHRRT